MSGSMYALGGLLGMLLAAAPWGTAAAAGPGPVAGDARAPRAARQADPFAPVYVVTSREDYQRFVRTLAPAAAPRFDSAGHALVLARVRAHELADISRYMHQQEHRCGGFFAFATAS